MNKMMYVLSIYRKFFQKKKKYIQKMCLIHESMPSDFRIIDLLQVQGEATC